MAQATEQPQSEREKVESWRLHVLVEAGYPLSLAEKLAHSEADLHRAACELDPPVLPRAHDCGPTMADCSTALRISSCSRP